MNSLSKIFKILFFFSLCFLVIKSDTSTVPGLLEKFEGRQIKKGINKEIVQNHGNVAFYVKIYDPKDESKILYDGNGTGIIGLNTVPQCMELFLGHMNLQERVKFRCPKERSFRSDMTTYFGDVKPDTEYIIDLQLWAIGDTFNRVE